LSWRRDFLLALRIGGSADYWKDVLPAVVRACSGSQLRRGAVDDGRARSVDTRHTGSASGFNSAVARTGGLVANGASGRGSGDGRDLLLRAFHTALWIGAAASAAAADGCSCPR